MWCTYACVSGLNLLPSSLQESQMNEREWVSKLKSLLKNLHRTEYEKVGKCFFSVCV